MKLKGTLRPIDGLVSGTLRPMGGLVGTIGLASQTIGDKRVRITQTGFARVTQNGDVRILPKISVGFSYLKGTLTLIKEV